MSYTQPVSCNIEMPYPPTKPIKLHIPDRIRLDHSDYRFWEHVEDLKEYALSRMNRNFDLDTVEIFTVSSLDGPACSRLEIRGSVGHKVGTPRHGLVRTFTAVYVDEREGGYVERLDVLGFGGHVDRYVDERAE